MFLEKLWLSSAAARYNIIRSHVAAILVLALQIFVLDECLLRGVLFASLLRDLLVLFWNFTFLELGELLMVLLPG